MSTRFQLETERLLLRPLEERDHVAFAAMNADPMVMTYFAAPMTDEQTREAEARYAAAIERDGFGFVTAEVRATGEFAGIVGMQIMREVVPNLPQPSVEIGWRLRREYQGLGYATEAARALVQYAFDVVKLPYVVAITAVGNIASRHVMEKLGMRHQPQLEFDHPRVPEGNPNRRTLLYRLDNPLSTSRAPIQEVARA